MNHRKETNEPARVRWLTEKEKADELSLSISFLRQDRMRQSPRIPFRRFGRAIRYLPENIAAE